MHNGRAYGVVADLEARNLISNTKTLIMNTDSKNTETKQCTTPRVVCGAFTDAELENMINFWLDHYTANGTSHCSDTKDWRIREIYWDKIVDRVIEDVNTEMTDDEIERFCNRLADL